MKRLSKNEVDKILNSSDDLVEHVIIHKKRKVRITQSNVACRTGKISYPSIQDAERARVLLKNKHKGVNWYKCEFCGQYHLTSIKKNCHGKMKF